MIIINGRKRSIAAIRARRAGRGTLSFSLAITLAALLCLDSCATLAVGQGGGAKAAGTETGAGVAANDETPVTWEPEVLADFEAKVPKFVKALARAKLEEKARERGSYLVDRALYDEAMAEYSPKQ